MELKFQISLLSVGVCIGESFNEDARVLAPLRVGMYTSDDSELAPSVGESNNEAPSAGSKYNISPCLTFNESKVSDFVDMISFLRAPLLYRLNWKVSNENTSTVCK